MILVDTNLAARLIQPTHLHHQAALGSLARLATTDSEQFAISVHSLYELYFLMTRPIPGNGFGYSAQQASIELSKAQSAFQPLPETLSVYHTWRILVDKYVLVNRICFDAKIVATMIENKIPRLLTFNDADFKFFIEIGTLNPFDVLGIPRV